MELIRTHKVHLAGQAGVIPQIAQIMGEGWNICWEMGSIVISTDARWQFSRQHRETGWGAQGAVAVCIFKNNPLFSQGGEVRCFDDRMSVKGQCRFHCIYQREIFISKKAG